MVMVWDDFQIIFFFQKGGFFFKKKKKEIYIFMEQKLLIVLLIACSRTVYTKQFWAQYSQWTMVRSVMFSKTATLVMLYDPTIDAPLWRKPHTNSGWNLALTSQNYRSFCIFKALFSSMLIDEDFFHISGHDLMFCM